MVGEARVHHGFHRDTSAISMYHFLLQPVVHTVYGLGIIIAEWWNLYRLLLRHDVASRRLSRKILVRWGYRSRYLSAHPKLKGHLALGHWSWYWSRVSWLLPGQRMSCDRMRHPSLSDLSSSSTCKNIQRIIIRNKVSKVNGLRTRRVRQCYWNPVINILVYSSLY